MTQKGQGRKLALVPSTTDDRKQQYVEQRARGAYLASICQPEAIFDLSRADQTTDESDYEDLNKRIQWQINHAARGINFVVLDLRTLKLFIFVDASFANDKDLSSQIGFVIVTE